MDKLIFLLITCLLLVCCKQSSKKVAILDAKTNNASLPEVFNGDSAYAFVGRQVQFGPRVPNTEAHRACARYLANTLERFCDTIYLQKVLLTAFNGDRLQASNIIGVFNPKQTKRLLLFAHWDSRPYSDQDIDVRNHYKPIDGADDGASGVGVLLEIARQISLKKIKIGVDIIFFDAEDYGVPNFINSKMKDTYCLGSQYWAKKPHVANYKAEYGILLDMVGSRNATFYKELHSMRNAKSIVERVWSTAQNKGFEKFFINETTGAITDDHIYVIEGRGIPCIDIINCDAASPHGFGYYWHTQQDRMDNISQETLEAVGQTIMEVIYTDF